MKNLARYIIRASFSQERMTYLRDESKVVYQGKDAKKIKTFDALVWLAAMPAPTKPCAEAGVPMCQTAVNRWCDITVIIAMLKGVNGKKRKRMKSFPPLLKMVVFLQKNGRPGLD